MFYVRDKEKRETDFLIIKENKPWCLIEAKLSDGPVARHHYDISHARDYDQLKQCKGGEDQTDAAPEEREAQDLLFTD